jgi:hypothetical protein
MFLDLSSTLEILTIGLKKMANVTGNDKKRTVLLRSDGTKRESGTSLMKL